MSASVFQMHAQIHAAEQIFVLQLLEGKAEKNSKNNALKPCFLLYSIACYEYFYGSIIK